MVTEQHAVCVLCPLRPEGVAAVEKALKAQDQRLRDNKPILFDRIGTVHFARFVVLKPTREGDNKPIGATHLLMTANVDGDPDRFLEDLVAADGKLIRTLYGQCEGFPDNVVNDAAVNDADVLTYLKSHQQGYGAFYVGAVGKSVEEIKREEALRRAIEDHIDGQQAKGAYGKDAAAIRRDIHAFVQGNKDLHWALEPPGVPRRICFSERLPFNPVLMLIAVIVIGLVLLGFVAPTVCGIVAALLLSVVGMLLVKEYRDNQHDYYTDIGRIHRNLRDGKVLTEEDNILQNPMTDITHMKPGRFRLYTLKFVFFLIDTLRKYVYNRGELGGIPSIHFARWLFIDGNKRLLFLSNYDGSWENYLGDFVDKAASGLTGVWSNTTRFPDTLLLFFRGARDEVRFKAYVRDTQVFTNLWYSAYPALSMEDIITHAKIRKGLTRPLSEDEAGDWLQLFSPPPQGARYNRC